jgi:hypothetical protein
MKVSNELLDLTNKFLKDFFDICETEENKEIDESTIKRKRERDELYYFNFTLAYAIAQSNYPKYDVQNTLLMGMASFDDSIAKKFMNNRCQGFVKLIEKRIKNTKDQEDYLVKNIKKIESVEDDFKLKFYKDENGKRNMKSIPCKTKTMDISFNVSNNKSGFSGSVVIHKKWDTHFTSKDKYYKKYVIDSIDFYCKKEKIMRIDYRFDFKNFTYYEEVEFMHYKHIADINSFYFVLACS